MKLKVGDKVEFVEAFLNASKGTRGVVTNIYGLGEGPRRFEVQIDNSRIVSLSMDHDLHFIKII